jgi:hypothetical protein
VSIGLVQLVVLSLSLVVAFREIGLILVAGSIELLSCVLNLIQVESQLFCELGDGVRPLRLLFGGAIGQLGRNRSIIVSSITQNARGFRSRQVSRTVISNVAKRCPFSFVIETFAVSRQRCYSYGSK